MNIIDGIQKKIKNGKYEYSKHAVDQTLLKNISVQEVKKALLSKIKIIEDYPEDFYGPSFLILGFTDKGRPIHVVCSYPSRPFIKLITVYEPDKSNWINNQIRK